MSTTNHSSNFKAIHKHNEGAKVRNRFITFEFLKYNVYYNIQSIMVLHYNLSDIVRLKTTLWIIIIIIYYTMSTRS